MTTGKISLGYVASYGGGDSSSTFIDQSCPSCSLSCVAPSVDAVHEPVPRSLHSSPSLRPSCSSSLPPSMAPPHPPPFAHRAPRPTCLSLVARVVFGGALKTQNPKTERKPLSGRRIPFLCRVFLILVAFKFLKVGERWRTPPLDIPFRLEISTGKYRKLTTTSNNTNTSSSALCICMWHDKIRVSNKWLLSMALPTGVGSSHFPWSAEVPCTCVSACGVIGPSCSNFFTQRCSGLLLVTCLGSRFETRRYRFNVLQTHNSQDCTKDRE